MPREKYCPNCKTIKDIDDFYIRKLSKDGHHYICKDCTAIKNAEYRATNKEKIKQCGLVYRICHKDTAKEYQKTYREKHKEVAKIYKAKYYQDNKQKLQEINKIHSNKYKKSGKFAKWQRNKENKDPLFKLQRRISTAIWFQLKTNKNKSKWTDLLGYSINDLISHLENLFLPGMSWANYGEWHIDHIKPKCTFAFSSPFDEEFRKCWSLSNLQPLWKKDNLSKGSRYNGSVRRAA